MSIEEQGAVPRLEFGAERRKPLYTAAERARRDATIWTFIQGVLAPVQFIVFLVSLGLVIRYLATGDGYEIATQSILAKTAFLYLIMVTGAIWEKVVFGQYLFAEAFFWEDVFSFAVIALHTAYLWALYTGALGPVGEMGIALAAYGFYVVNAAQFIWKLRQARLDAERTTGYGAELAETPARPRVEQGTIILSATIADASQAAVK